MAQETLLIGLAQVAFVAPALAALITLMGPRSVALTPQETQGVRLMVELGVLLVVCCLAPLVAVSFGGGIDWWRWLAPALGTGVFLIAGTQHQRSRRLRPRFPGLHRWTLVVPFALLAALEFANVAIGSVGVYVLGLTLIFFAQVQALSMLIIGAGHEADRDVASTQPRPLGSQTGADGRDRATAHLRRGEPPRDEAAAKQPGEGGRRP